MGLVLFQGSEYYGNMEDYRFAASCCLDGKFLFGRISCADTHGHWILQRRKAKHFAQEICYETLGAGECRLRLASFVWPD